MKDISIQAAAAAVAKPEHLQKAQKGQGGSGKFAAVLQDSLQEVNRLQVESDQAVRDLAAGRAENIHETMIAMEKASISFEMMMQVRNKIIEAYKEIMKSTM